MPRLRLPLPAVLAVLAVPAAAAQTQTQVEGQPSANRAVIQPAGVQHLRFRSSPA